MHTSSNLSEAVTKPMIFRYNVVKYRGESKGENASSVISEAYGLERLDRNLQTVGHKPPSLADSTVPSTSARFIPLTQSIIRIFPYYGHVVSGHKTAVCGREVRLCDERLNSVADGDQGRLSQVP
jgi:hypothetical protein